VGKLINLGTCDMPIAVSDGYQRLRTKRAEENEKDLVKEFTDKFGDEQGITRLSEITGNSRNIYRKILEILKRP